MTSQLVDFDYPIIISALAVLFCGTAVLSTVVRKEIALGVMLIKVSVVVVYFCFFADGEWFYGGDDTGYFERGMRLARADANILTIWGHPEGFYLRHGHSLSLIYFHNYLAILLMGENYYATVFLNVFLTTILIVMLTKICNRFVQDDQYATFFVIFASLHWSILTWSSFLNLKGVLVSCLGVLCLWALISIREKPLIATLSICTSIYLMTRIRYYFPVFLIGALIIGNLDSITQHWQHKKALFIAILLLCLLGIALNYSQIGLFFRFADFGGFPYGVIHFVLQPAPWRITEPASYLLIASILHWIMFLPTIIGCVMIWREHRAGRLVVGLVIAGIVFYGFVQAIASTRHRMPLDFLIILAQYHFFWNCFQNRKGSITKHMVSDLRND